MNKDYGFSLKATAVTGEAAYWRLEKDFGNGVKLSFRAAVLDVKAILEGKSCAAVAGVPRDAVRFILDPPGLCEGVEGMEKFSASLRSALGWLKENPELPTTNQG